MPHPGQLASPSLLDLVIKCVYTSHLPPKSRNRQGMRSAHPTVTTACPSVVSTPTGNSCCKLTAVCVIDGVIQSTFRIELCSRTRRNALPRNVPQFAHNLWDIISHNARPSRPCPVGITPGYRGHAAHKIMKTIVLQLPHASGPIWRLFLAADCLSQAVLMFLA